MRQPGKTDIDRGITKTVGVYDRPAGADRLGRMRIVALVVAVVIGALVTYWYLH
jgi:hypothetical protein